MTVQIDGSERFRPPGTIDTDIVAGDTVRMRLEPGQTAIVGGGDARLSPMSASEHRH